MTAKRLIVFLYILFNTFAYGAIQEFNIIEVLPSLSQSNLNSRTGSSIALKLRLKADPGVYSVRAIRQGFPNQIINSREQFSHTGEEDFFVKLSLNEGSNSFALTVVGFSVAVTPVTTTINNIVRDLEYNVTNLTLNHLQESGGAISLYTTQPEIEAHYTLNGNASSYEIKTFINGTEVKSDTVFSTGNGVITNIPLVANQLNLVQLKAQVLDQGASNLGIQKESDFLRMFHDTTAPVITGVSTTLPGGTADPAGPTELAVFGLIVETNEPFAQVHVTNSRNTNKLIRMTDLSGRVTIAGVELERDPTVSIAGTTETTYTVIAFDAAGNQATAETQVVRRLTLEPCFNLLSMQPFDGAFIGQNQSISVLGAVCNEVDTHRIMFRVSSIVSGSQFLVEEQLTNVAAGVSFQKDISIPFDALNPNQNASLEVQAIVISPRPDDATLEEFSPPHNLGSVIFDRVAPSAPNLLTQDTFFATNSNTILIDGDGLEPEGGVFVHSPTNFNVRPAANIGALEDEFRGLISIGDVQDGEYTVDIISKDKAQNSGPGSKTQLVIKIDRTAPTVKNIKINNAVIESGDPIFFLPGTTVNIKVLLSEKLEEAPFVWVTQQAGYAQQVGLSNTFDNGLEFEYQYVVQSSNDGKNDGAVEILVTGGRDSAGNTLVPSFREPQAFIVDSLAPKLFRQFVTPSDGSVINAAPSPLRLVMSDDSSNLVVSGADPMTSTVSCIGPLETDPTHVVEGRLEVFDPRTIDFYPNSSGPSAMVTDGTYLFQITMRDKVGNSFVESIVLQLDTESLSPNLIVTFTPQDHAYYNADTLPRENSLPLLSISVEETLTSEIDLLKSEIKVFNYLRSPQEYKVSKPQSVSSSSVKFHFKEDLLKDGTDDGILVANATISDIAGNVSNPKVYQYTYDTKVPSVMDGINFPIPDGFEQRDSRIPSNRSVVKGPLNILSSYIFDQRSSNGYLGSGLRAQTDSQNTLPTSTVVLRLEHPFGSVPAGLITSSRIKFKADASGNAPVFGGPLVGRLLFELNVDPVSLDPIGLQTDGSMDGIYKMEILPVDLSLNVGEISTSYFMYDTITPNLSIALNNDIWITSGVLEFSGFAQDEQVINSAYPLFGGTNGLGVQKVEVRVESVNNIGSATYPEVLAWTEVPLNKKLVNYPKSQKFEFQFSQKFYNFKGDVRLTFRAIDKAGNERYVIKDLSLNSDLLSPPQLVSPIDGYRLSGGIQRFEWKTEPTANSYVLVITDKDNNSTEFPFDRETIQADVNLGFLQEGVASWRVIAIDGINQRSETSNGRTIIMDRSIPDVENYGFDRTILPDNLQGTILNGDLRFHITFTENMDTSKTPLVRFYPASKTIVNAFNQEVIEVYPPITLNQLSYEGNKYVGNFKILPEDGDVDYNGLGYIKVENYYDLSNNVGLTRTHNFEVDLGPYFEFRIFSHPSNDNEIIFVIKGLHQKGGTDEDVSQLPYMQIRQLKDPGTQSTADEIQIVNLTRLTSSAFHGGYLLNLNLSGSLQIEITGVDVQGNSITRVIPFQVKRLAFSQSKVSEISQAVSRIEPTFYVFPWTTNQKVNQDNLPLFNMFPKTSLAKDSNFEINLNDYVKGNVGKYAVMESSVDGLTYQTQIMQDDKIYLSSSNPSKLLLIEDSKNPILEIDQSIDLEALESDLLIKVEDLGVGVNLDALKVKINNSLHSVTYDEDSFIRVSKSKLQQGQMNNVEINAMDYLGNSKSLSLLVKPVGPIAFQESIVVPNPIRSSNAQLKLKLNRTATKVHLSLYDSASSRIHSQNMGQISKDSYLPLDQFNLDSLANGIYFMKIQIEDSDGNTNKKIVKLAIIK
ncbi:MAG: T9SS type A sorting domain-containing protein [Candidatus Cloacimonetes bacterium]|nr:T9SS type A sorting domain-containing protein [Candidatus Cloacimonadota bacterium]